MAEQFNLGQVATVSKGNYSAGAQYKLLNTVYANGGTWMCIAPVIGVEPGKGADWQSYWLPMANGIKETNAESTAPGQVKVTFTYSDGRTTSFSFNTNAIPPNSVGTNELKNLSVSGAKIANQTITEGKMDPNYTKKFAPKNIFGQEDKVNGSPSNEPEGSIYFVVEPVT